MMTKPLARQLLLEPFQKFVQLESAGGIVLFLAAVLAVVWANSPWRDAYFSLWQTQYTLGVPGMPLGLSLHHWINDGLMAIFFLLVGLEIKRELLVGELSQPRQASLPIMAAVGGMVVPGLVYILINPPSGAFNHGWGIPMVTDIAFSLGVLALLGKRIPLFLKVFLTALAIVDDLGAVLIIALFYSSGLHWGYLSMAAFLIILLLGLNRCKVAWLPVYGLLGVGLWVAVFHSGIHSTLAGVLLATTIPACGQSNTGVGPSGCLLDTEGQVNSPLYRLEQGLHPWVTYGIMPLFAFANAGVSVSKASFVQFLYHPIALGVMAGLVLGKPVGITLFSWLSVQWKLAELPAGICWPQMVGLACLGGIGFTMSLFIANLAFGIPLADTAKVGIMVASLGSGLLGTLVLFKTCKLNCHKG
jgi:NhaA family Na+:H+ antiporter